MIKSWLPVSASKTCTLLKVGAVQPASLHPPSNIDRETPGEKRLKRLAQKDEPRVSSGPGQTRQMGTFLSSLEIAVKTSVCHSLKRIK